MYATCPLCKSHFCAVRSPEVCITYHRRRDAGKAKNIEKPPEDAMVKRAPVTK
jgi:hypothetical protein